MDRTTTIRSHSGIPRVIYTQLNMTEIFSSFPPIDDWDQTRFESKNIVKVIQLGLEVYFS